MRTIDRLPDLGNQKCDNFCNKKEYTYESVHQWPLDLHKNCQRIGQYLLGFKNATTKFGERERLGDLHEVETVSHIEKLKFIWFLVKATNSGERENFCGKLVCWRHFFLIFNYGVSVLSPFFLKG